GFASFVSFNKSSRRAPSIDDREQSHLSHPDYLASLTLYIWTPALHNDGGNLNMMNRLCFRSKPKVAKERYPVPRLGMLKNACDGKGPCKINEYTAPILNYVLYSSR